jgi:hypothetical protein
MGDNHGSQLAGGAAGPVGPRHFQHEILGGSFGELWFW